MLHLDCCPSPPGALCASWAHFAMSYGCGTLSSPHHKMGSNMTAKAASGNGKQHNIPAKTMHPHITKEMVEAHWEPRGASGKSPTRLWGSASATKFGGEIRADGEPQAWTSGEMWNCDSNIRKWGEHEMRRNAAASSHDVHRHDQIGRVVLQPMQGAKRQMAPRLCLSGCVSADSSFLEAWGFDLGLRDRQAKPVSLWQPVTKNEQFRGLRSYERDIPRVVENNRSLRRTASTPGVLPTNPDVAFTLRPEDIGGEAGDSMSPDANDLEKQGRTHGSRSCRGWDGYDHASKREAARLSNAIHSPMLKEHPEGYPFVDEVELHPAAIYTRRFKQGGENACRRHVGRSQRVPMH